MEDDASPRDAPTRRDYLVAGGAIVGTGLVTGCLGGEDGTVEPSVTETADRGNTTTSEAGSGGHSATLSPAGTVQFDEVPESIFTVFSLYADMAVALGHGDGVNAVYPPEMAGTTMNQYYHHLDGVSFEWEGLYDPLAEGLSKERLYALDSDVHLAGPVWAARQDGWDEADVAEVADNVGPWFGNRYSGTHASIAGYEGDYEYYTLWELFGHVADVFQERQRYEALASVHADLVSRIEADLPPESARPSAVRVSIAADGDSFYTYHLNKPGYWLADTRPLGATDAFADRDWEGLWGEVDVETMLAADPDVILALWDFTPSRSIETTRQTLAAHPVGSQLRAVQHDRVYPQGMRYQGPLMNLFQLEMTAKQLYPDVFGEWPTYTDGEPYPDIPADEQLFDRERVAAIVRGEG